MTFLRAVLMSPFYFTGKRVFKIKFTFAKQLNYNVMKKIIVLAATVSLILLSGCQSAGKGNPKEVLHQFLTALSQKDFKKAKTLATQDSDGMISMMEMGMQNMQNMDKGGHADKMMDMINNMKMGDAVIDGDKATVSVTDSKSNESTDFLLKKENGDWKVAFDMSTLMEMANKKMKEHGLNGLGNMDSAQIRQRMDSAMNNMRSMDQGAPLKDSSNQ
jgi:hypothetical protein